VIFVDGSAGMLVFLTLFFVIDPAFSILAGIFAGRDIKKLWSIPFIVAFMFVIGSWLVFEMGERAFIWYGIIYFILGVVSMIVSFWAKRRTYKNNR